jgi:putative flippase GtrA
MNDAVSQSDPVRRRSRPRIRKTLDIPVMAVANRFEGKRAKEVERFLKFAFVGAIGAVVDSGMLVLLQATILPPDHDNTLNVTLASILAFLAATVSNFFLNRHWTYPDSRSRSIRRQLTQFTVVNAVGGISRTIWITLAYRWLGAALMPLFIAVVHVFNSSYSPTLEAQNKFGTMAAWFIGVWVVMIWNFFINRYWTYNDVE